MTSYEDRDPLQELADEQALLDRLRQLIYETQDRIAAHLSAHGVPLPAAVADAPPIWMLHPASHLPEPAAPDDPDRLAQANVDRVAELSAVIAVSLVTQEMGGTPDPETKKRLQARCLMFEDHKIWLDLVDTELPGEPLDPERDLEILYTLTEWHAEHDRLMQAFFESAHLDFTRLLELGDGLPTDTERLVLWRLTKRFCAWAAEPTLHATNSWAEVSRTFLLESGIALTPGWMRVIGYQLESEDIEVV